MKLTREEVEKIANLARLKVSPTEADQFAHQLTDIFTFIEKLNELDTSNIEASAHTFETATPLRDDVNVQSPARDAILEQAPDKEDTLFKVPKVI